MASWTQNQPSGSTRRRWNLEDRNSLNNLKYHIATEGCSDVQYDLAKQLLTKSIDQNDERSKQEAVHWLICATQQGHEDATKLLRQCYEEGCGITTENESEVISCLTMTPGERAARKAARELFACLSNGGEHISAKQLERKMREIYNLQKRRHRRGTSTSEEDSDGETTHQPIEGVSGVRSNRSCHSQLNLSSERVPLSDRVITEENLVSAAANYSAGRMPAVNDSLTLSVPHPESLDHVPCFHRLLFHPIIFLRLLYHRLINFIAAIPVSIPPAIRVTFLLLAYWVSFSETFPNILPIGCYYLCLVMMTWSTCKMLKTKQDFIDFRIWSGLFLNYGDHNIEADISENRFLKNNLRPFLYFFCAFVGNLMLYPFVPSEWLLHSELTILSSIFVFVTLIVFMYSSSHRLPDWVVLVSFGVNVLAKYPYEMDEVVTTGWRFLDLKVPNFPSFVIGNGIEFCLNCRTALYLLIPFFLVQLAKRSRWHGTYTYLIPHCVTLSWLQLSITASQSATMFGVVRSTLGLSGILLFLPLFGIVSLLIPVFVFIEWIGFADPDFRLGSTVVAAVVAVLGSCSLAMNRTTQKYVTPLQMISCILAAIVLTYPYMTSNFQNTDRFGKFFNNDKRSAVLNSIPTEDQLSNVPEVLTWQRFHDLCGPPAWEHNNKIAAQLRCSHLNGAKVSWQGTVSQVQISRVSNKRAELIAKYFPVWLGNLIRCIYGESSSDSLQCDNPTQADSLCDDLKAMLKNDQVTNKCSLMKWNTYDYEIRIRMPSGLLSNSVHAVLHASHDFGNFTHKISAGDRVHFYGTLLNSRMDRKYEEEYVLGGSSDAYIHLNAIECLMCLKKNISPIFIGQKPIVNARVLDLMRGLKYLLNVLLNPLVTFK